MYAQGLLFVVMMGKLFRKLFLGSLELLSLRYVRAGRALCNVTLLKKINSNSISSNFQHLVERSWYAVTETCLAFTVFRDDFSPKFLALFTLLLFLKSFHWLAEERVDFVSGIHLFIIPLQP